MSFAATQLIGFGVMTSVARLSFVTSGNATATTIAVPAGTQVGDLIVFYDACGQTSGGAPASVTPTGFTLVSTSVSAGTGGIRQNISYKVADAGDIGATITGMVSGTGTARKAIAVFRPDAPIWSVTTGGLSQEGTGGNPVLQTIDITGALGPLLLIGGARGEADPASSGTLVTNGVAITTASATHDAYYEIQNTTLASRTFDMNDVGSANCLASFYMSFR